MYIIQMTICTCRQLRKAKR